MSIANPPRKKEMINRVEKWLTESFYAVRKVPDIHADVNFEVKFGPDDVRLVNFAFPRAANDVVTITAGLQFTGDRLTRIRQLPLKERDDFIWRIRFALLERNFSHKFEPSQADFDRLRIWRNVYFDGLTKNFLLGIGGEAYMTITSLMWETDKLMGSPPTDDNMLSWRGKG